MLNKPKFMIPSTGMQECVVDVDAENIPFSCIVDGNEPIAAWQIKIYDIKTNMMVLDTGKQTLDVPFFPIDNKNRNVVFPVNLKKYLTSSTYKYFPATPIYNKNITYYKANNQNDGTIKYTEYKPTSTNIKNWSTIYNDCYYYGNFINSSESYYWTIDMWNEVDASIEGKSATTSSCEEVFYASDTPKPVIKYSINDSDYKELSGAVVLPIKKCEFKATYEEDVLLKRYGWRLTDVKSGQVLHDTITKNRVYGTKSNMILSYDGFLNNGNYSIEIYVETQNGCSVITEPITFSVEYETMILDSSFSVSALSDEPGIINVWGSPSILTGVNNGEIKFKSNYPINGSNSVEIPKNSDITYDISDNISLDLSEDSYISMGMQLLSSENHKILYLDGTDKDGNSVSRTLEFEGGRLKYTVLNSEISVEKIYTPKTTPGKYVWFVITMSPFLGVNGDKTSIEVTEYKAVEGLYPDKELYPSTSYPSTRYPTFGRWEEEEE